MAVGKENLARKVSEKTGLNLIDAKLIVATFLDAIKGELAKGKRVELRGFGRFFIKEKKARTARNPRNGQKIDVGRKFSPVFKISNELVKKLNEGRG